MNNDAIEHLKSFIKEFVPKSHKNRWLSLLDVKTPRLNKIKPYDIWPEDNQKIPNCSILKVSFHELLQNKPFINYKDLETVVIPCGHDNNSPISMKLHEVIDGNFYLLEGIISIIKGKLVIMVNHDGEACIFNKI